MFQIQVREDLGSDASLALDPSLTLRKRRKARLLVKDKCTFPLEFFDRESTRILVEINDRSAARFLDHFHGLFQQPTALAPRSPENVAQ